MSTCSDITEVQEDPETVPLAALRQTSRRTLSLYLNRTKVLPSPQGLPRDWRGLAHVSGAIAPLVDSSDPTGDVLSFWEKEKATIAQLKEALAFIDRFDVLDDSLPFIEEDIKEYQKGKCDVICNRTLVKLDNDHDILTIDDVYLVEQGHQPQIYDAFLLYADEDSEFAGTVVDKLENDYALKLCLKDRDLVGGITFEHDAIMRLISERCNRLIIIVSPSFLNSPANKFFVMFAQAIGIEQRQRKIVPCIYQKFLLPPQLNYYFVLDYTRSGRLWNFWDKLSQSVSSPSFNAHQPQIRSRCNLLPIQGAPSPCPVVALPPEPSAPPPVQAATPDAPPSPSPAHKPAQEAVKRKPLMSLLTRLLPSPPADPPSPKTKTRLWLKRKEKAISSA